jgi:hypothetical protein
MNTENKHRLTVTLNCASTDAPNNKTEYPFSLLLDLVIILTSVRQNKAQCIFCLQTLLFNNMNRENSKFVSFNT